MTAPHPDAPPVASAGAEATPPDVSADRVIVLECTTVLPTPDMLRAKLLRDGWKERPAGPDASIFDLHHPDFDGPLNLVLPHGEAIGDGWLSSVVGALRTLAGLEDRPDGVRDRPAGDIAAEIVAEHGRRGRDEGGKDG